MKSKYGWKFVLNIWTLTVIMFLVGCAGTHDFVREKKLTIYVAEEEKSNLIQKYAPVFMVENYREAFNRIGSPTARIDDQGNEDVYVDHRKPAFYHMTRSFKTNKANYTNLVYRVHFPEVPFSLIPFSITAGKNAGVLTVITLDEKEKPVLVTTVGTCGCYVAIIPTSYLPSDSYPADWEETHQDVYGERLPSILDLNSLTNPRLMISFRSHVHRVMDIKAIEDDGLLDTNQYYIVKASLFPTLALEKIPLNGEATSFYHDKWPLKGHVKDAIKIWETLFVSIISLDLFVGTDKVYGDPKVTGNPFYTSLKPWNRKASDMWDFSSFLEFWGWRL